MSNIVRDFLFVLLCAFTIWQNSGEATATRARSQRLVERYLNRVGERLLVDGKRMSWYCRRGTKLAICRNREKRLRAITTAQPSIKPSQLRAKDTTVGRHRLQGCPIDCQHGKCKSGRCRCDKGWTGRRCNIDVNECSRKRHSCSHVCVNTAGGHRCICRAGYKLLTNGRTCRKSAFSQRSESSVLKAVSVVPVNRQRRPLHETSPLTGNRYRSSASLYLSARRKQKMCRKGCRYRCAVENDVEKCFCPQGFSLARDERSCIDRNECLDATGPVCPQNQKCVNTFGSFACRCSSGYVLSHSLSGKVCEDVNECLTGEHECGPNAYCINTVGSHACTCQSGYQKNGSSCVSAASRPTNSLTGQNALRYP